MLVAGVEEQLGLVGRLHECPRSINIAFANKDWIGVHSVDLNRGKAALSGINSP
jgi:hypothetical protein